MIDSENNELVAMKRGGGGGGIGGGGGQGARSERDDRNNRQQGITSSSGTANGVTSSSSGGSSSIPGVNAPLNFPLNRGILGFCATSGKLVNSLDARKDWRFDPEVDSHGDLHTRSLLVVPVTDHLSKPIAIIQAVNKKVNTFQGTYATNPITGGSASGQQQGGQGGSSSSGRAASPPRGMSGPGGRRGSVLGTGPLGPAPVTTQVPYFTRDEEALLQSMAVSAGILLRKSALYEEAVSTRKKTEALLQISELMSADLQSDKIMSKIVQAAHMLVSAEIIVLYMVDEAASELVCEVGKDGFKGTRIPLGHGVAGHTALTGRSLNLADAQNDWRFDPGEHSHMLKNRVQTILAIPVKDFLGKNVGTLGGAKNSIGNAAVYVYALCIFPLLLTHFIISLRFCVCVCVCTCFRLFLPFLLLLSFRLPPLPPPLF